MSTARTLPLPRRPERRLGLVEVIGHAALDPPVRMPSARDTAMFERAVNPDVLIRQGGGKIMLHVNTEAGERWHIPRLKEDALREGLTVNTEMTVTGDDAKLALMKTKGKPA